MAYANSKGLTPKQIEGLEKALSRGATYERAAQIVGCHVISLHAMRRKGHRIMEEADEKGLRIPRKNRYVRIALACETGREKWINTEIELIRIHGERDWRALAWLLERMEPQRFGARANLNVVSQEVDARTSELDLTKLSDADLDMLEAIMLKGAKEEVT